MPHARHTDPTTSHEAAKSLTHTHLTETKKVILAILNEPHTDEELQTMFDVATRLELAPKASLSSIRSRRNELYREGLIEPIGYGKTIANRRAIIWQRINGETK